MATQSDSDQERTLPASPRRLEQAREEGQIPRSRALAHLAVIGTAAGILWFAGPHLIARYSLFLRSALQFNHKDVAEASAMPERLGALVFDAGSIALPILALIAAAGAIASIGLGGWIFTFKPVVPNFSKLNPITGFGRMFSVRSLTELLKVMVEAVVIVAVVGIFLWNAVPEFAELVAQTQEGGLTHTVRVVLAGVLAMVLALALTATVDVPLQLWRHHQSLRMSMEELKRESRETDGDPQLRQRIRSLQREMARRRMMEEVPKADVVITNPTHFAVALAYRDNEDGAPLVVAKGVDLMAERIRSLARSAKVPVIESPALARALNKHAEVGEHIPEALYEAVAQVLAYVFRLRKGVDAAAPGSFEPVDIPPGLDPNGALR
ncbi:MAG: flagellar biosynthesis protein FlhB [Burkholderiales bacterium]